jgi:hypothetical protein
MLPHCVDHHAQLPSLSFDSAAVMRIQSSCWRVCMVGIVTNVVHTSSRVCFAMQRSTTVCDDSHALPVAMLGRYLA